MFGRRVARGLADGRRVVPSERDQPERRGLAAGPWIGVPIVWRSVERATSPLVRYHCRWCAISPPDKKHSPPRDRAVPRLTAHFMHAQLSTESMAHHSAQVSRAEASNGGWEVRPASAPSTARIRRESAMSGLSLEKPARTEAAKAPIRARAVPNHWDSLSTPVSRRSWVRGEGANLTPFSRASSKRFPFARAFSGSDRACGSLGRPPQGKARPAPR